LERAGIAADREYLEGLQAEFASAARGAVERAHEIVGREFNLGSPKQLQQVLFEDLELPKTKKIKSGYTTDADALAWLATQTDSELPGVLLHHRDQTKLRTTVEGLIKTVADDGRIHTTFNQTIAATFPSKRERVHGSSCSAGSVNSSIGSPSLSVGSG
jgi:DNA polymerase I